MLGLPGLFFLALPPLTAIKLASSGPQDQNSDGVVSAPASPGEVSCLCLGHERHQPSPATGSESASPH